MEEVERALLDVGVGEAAAGLAADQLGLDAEVTGHGGNVGAGRLQELALFGRDTDGLEAGGVAQDGDAAAALVAGVPPFLQVGGLLAGDALVGGEHPRRGRSLPEPLGAELLNG